ncbi:hypothetical protein [Rhodoplanes azumiensis]|uniref:Uncharacterized protein n=1 Tax=Rhodoplanes azumiensis TaxID=1897628 RepID=A0ABW5AEK4_9BRAD
MLDSLAKFASLLSAVFGGVIIGYLGYEQKSKTDEFNVQTACLSIIERIANKYEGRVVQIRELDARIELFPNECALRRTKLVDFIRVVATVQENTPDGIPVVAVPAPPSQAGQSEAGTLAGWVAVGFVESQSSGDVNFLLANGRSVTPGVGPGTVLRAKWQVNVRSTPAGWRSVVGTLNIGQCFTVDEQKSLAAGDRTQLWVRGKAIPCSST